MKKLILALALVVSFSVQAVTIEELEKAKPSDLNPYGELAKMFNIGSKNTDLQRDIKLKEIVGKVVQWKLPVYEVDKGDTTNVYQIDTKNDMFNSGSPVGTTVYITTRNENEKKLIESIKTDDVISFKGVISEDSSRRLKIIPAIFASNGDSAKAEQPTVAEQPKQKEAQPQVTQESQPEATKQPEQSKSWQGDWGNGIIAIVSSESCGDRTLISEGYNYLMSVSIPKARLKVPTDAWQVLEDRAITITGCWIKKPDNMIHAKLTKKKGNKTWEQDFKMDDGNWIAK